MKKVFSSLVVLFLLLSCISTVNVVKADEVSAMSIKLKNYIGNQNQLTISVKGEYDIQGTAFSLIEGKTYTVKVENNSLSLYENSILVTHFTSFIAVPKIYGTSNYIIINNRPYLGTMKFVVENSSYVRPINTLPMEDYLKGVVPFEMMGSWNKEALKAQAVAARTYATRYTSKEIDDTISYQAYGGYEWYSNSTAAVEETKSQTLTYNGTIIDAVYSASNGGMTESNANVWGGTPLAIFPVKADPYDTKVPWSFTLKKTQINTSSLDLANPQNWWNSAKEVDTTLVSNIKNWMYQNGYANDEIKITSIPALSFSDNKTSGGRVLYGTITLQFFLKDKTTGLFVMDSNNKIKSNTLSFTNTTASRIRAMIGISVIKSYLVTSYKDDGTTYSVSGSGNGHGVGMSQWGAKVMGDQGLNYRDILNFYYPGTTLTNSNSVPVVVNNSGTGSSSGLNGNPGVTAPASSSDGNPVVTTPTSSSNENPVVATPASGSDGNPVVTAPTSSSNENPVVATPDPGSDGDTVVAAPTSDSNGYPVTPVPASGSNENPVASTPASGSNENPVASTPTSGSDGSSVVPVPASEADGKTVSIPVSESTEVIKTPSQQVPKPSPLTKPKPPSIANVSSAYVAKDKQITVNYTVYEDVTATVYVKNPKGTILSYPIRNTSQKAGSHLVILNVSTQPNGIYSFGIIITNQANQTSSVLKTVTVNKPLQAPKVNAVSNIDVTVTGTSEPKATVTIKSGSKVLKSGVADSIGKFKITILKQPAGTKLSITAKDIAGNVSTAATITVLDKIAPSTPKVNTVTYWDTVVTGTTEAKATVTIKVGSRVLGTAKADTKGKFSVKITKQRVGSSLSVTSKDSAGNVSKAFVLKVKTRR